MDRTVIERLRLVMAMALVFGCTAASLGGVLASLHAPNQVMLPRGGGPGSGQGEPRLADPAPCGPGRNGPGWSCHDPVVGLA
ncbi:MAG TPA: hypothetical protein VEC11_03940 [Allosphingosinicella sp.]|nr:hypothetical protein [Allosphingosinicella sp.]